MILPRYIQIGLTYSFEKYTLRYLVFDKTIWFAYLLPYNIFIYGNNNNIEWKEAKKASNVWCFCIYADYRSKPNDRLCWIPSPSTYFPINCSRCFCQLHQSLCQQGNLNPIAKWRTEESKNVKDKCTPIIPPRDLFHLIHSQNPWSRHVSPGSWRQCVGSQTGHWASSS